MSWYLSALKDYFTFKGRARRMEYWMFLLFNIIFSIAAFVLDLILGTYIVFYALYGLAVLIPGLAVSIRRLHDVDKSGAWIFINLVPLIGAIWYLVLMFTEGTRGQNSYGQDPKGNPVELNI